MGSACGTCTSQATFASFIEGSGSIASEVQCKSSNKNRKNEEFTHSFIKDGITQFSNGEEEPKPKVQVNLIHSNEVTTSSYFNEIEHSENLCMWDSTSKRIEDFLHPTGARPSVKWSSDGTEVSGTFNSLSPNSQLKVKARPSEECNDSPCFTDAICQYPSSFESTSVGKGMLDQVYPLRWPATKNLTSTEQGTNDDANANKILLDLHVSDRNGGKEVNMISSQVCSRYQIPSETKIEFRNSEREVYGIMCWDLCWLRGDNGNDPTDYDEKMCVTERLKSPVSISPAVKYTTTRASEMSAWKRTLADAYIEAMPSSCQNKRSTTNAVDNIWKEVTTMFKGERVLLRDRYLKEVARLRSRKEDMINNKRQPLLAQSRA